MLTSRKSGVLLPLFSLPGGCGVGDLGRPARDFIRLLCASGMRLWQFLPWHPVDGGMGYSPYSSPSAFAGNLGFISLDDLVADGLLQEEDWPERGWSPDQVDYDRVLEVKAETLRKAHRRFRESPDLHKEWAPFLWRHAAWIEDYVLFCGAKIRHNHEPWWQWPQPLRDRHPPALKELAEQMKDELDFHRFVQWVFFRQLKALCEFAREQGVTLVDDVPLYVSHDSADVWAHRQYFDLNDEGRPHRVAGVPPDYFSATGQLWGNPLYRWDKLAFNGYAWWLDRLRHHLRYADMVRLDHFRGFASYWSVPADSNTAQKGRWEPGPGAAFFEFVKDALNGLPFIVEDLGIITDDVVALRDQFELPGMRLLLFAFGEDDYRHHAYLPENHPPNCVAYTGTHDNNTLVGWWRREATDSEKRSVRAYIGDEWDGQDEKGLVRALLERLWSSKARWVIVPVQDILGLDQNARINVPARSTGNWRWRLTRELLNAWPETWLQRLNHKYNRD